MILDEIKLLLIKNSLRTKKKNAITHTHRFFRRVHKSISRGTRSSYRTELSGACKKGMRRFVFY